MDPIPQSPWTLAIAELIGLRLAALGSGVQPADLLANLLPEGEPLPEGWLDSFLANTPIPGYAVPTLIPGASSPSAPAGSLASLLESPASPLAGDAIPDEIAEGGSPLGLLAGTTPSASQSLDTSAATLISQSAAPGAAQSAPAAVQLPPGWETVRQMLPGASDEEPGQSLADLLNSGGADGGFSSPRSPGDDRRQAAGSPPSPRAGGSGSSPGSGAKQVGQDVRVQVNLQFDPRKFAEQMKEIASGIAMSTVSRILFQRDAQIAANRRF